MSPERKQGHSSNLEALQVKRFLPCVGLFILVCCAPSGLEESIDRILVATNRNLQVPDSSRYNNIQVRIVALLGPSTAYSLDRIEYTLSDTLFRFVVFSRHKEQTGDVVREKEIILDSTMVLVLNPPKFGKHYFKLFDNQPSVLSDSTIVY